MEEIDFNSVEYKNTLRKLIVKGIEKNWNRTKNIRFAAHSYCFVNGHNPDDEIFEDLFQESFIKLIHIGAKYVTKHDDWEGIIVPQLLDK